MARADIRTALVTGGARRIGRAIVEDLAAHGFSVAIHCNSSIFEAEALARTIVEAGGAAVAVRADLAEPSASESIFDVAEAALGPVALLVNSASVFETDTFPALDWAAFDRHFDIHVKAPLRLAATFTKRLPAGVEGLIVNIVDQRVLHPSPAHFSYALSKAALHAATATLAQSLSPGIRVNAIGPGPALKNLRQSDADFQAQIDGLILRRGPALDEFGATIRYLWGARSVTGQTIALDGGQHLGWETPDVAGIVE